MQNADVGASQLICQSQAYSEYLTDTERFVAGPLSSG